MKLEEAESLAKRRIRIFAESRKSLISANRERFITTSWKEGQVWCVAAAVFPKAAMTKSLGGDLPENRAVNWVVARVANSGEVTIKEINDLEALLKA